MKDKVIQVLTAHLRSNEKDYAEFTKVRTALKEQEGKEVSTRWKKYLPDGYKIGRSHNNSYIAYSPEHWFNITYDLGYIYLDSIIVERNRIESVGAPKRIEQLKAMLKDDRKINAITDSLEKVRAAVETLQEVYYGELFDHANPASSDLFILANFTCSLRGKLWDNEHSLPGEKERIAQYIEKHL